MIINIRGTSGSGKTTIVRGIIALGRVEKIQVPDVRKVYGYAVYGATQRPILIVGSYENVCGGCDGISTQDDICDRVRKMAPLGHVVLEGLLMSHTYERYHKLSRELGGIAFMFLDTPLEKCLARVQARREAKGNTTPLDPKNTADKWNSNRKTFNKFKYAGDDVSWLNHENGVAEVMNRLKQAEADSTTTWDSDECEAAILKVFGGA